MFVLRRWRTLERIYRRRLNCRTTVTNHHIVFDSLTKLELYSIFWMVFTKTVDYGERHDCRHVFQSVMPRQIANHNVFLLYSNTDVDFVRRTKGSPTRRSEWVIPGKTCLVTLSPALMTWSTGDGRAPCGP